MKTPLVSCVVIAYNYEKYVRNAVDSVLAQTGFQPGDIEIIAVDDGSTDSTPGILTSYGNRIRVIRQKNQGPTVAMAAGIAAARGTYIAFLDADDEWTSERLRTTVDHLEANPHVGLVHSDMSIMDGAGNTLQATTLALPATQPQTGRILGALLIGNQVTRSAITVRADLARAASQAPAWAWCSDWWLAAQIAVQHAISVLPMPLVRYRSHGDNYNGLINRTAEKTQRLMERDVRVRRILLRSIALSAVTPSQLTQALSMQLQTLGQLAQANVDVKALMAITATDLAEVEALLTLARQLANSLPEEALRLAARAIAIDPFNTTAQQFFRTLNVPPPATQNQSAPPESDDPWTQAIAQQLTTACPALLALPNLRTIDPLQAWAVWQRLRALQQPIRILELGLGVWAAPLAAMTQTLNGSFWALGLDAASSHALEQRLRQAKVTQGVNLGETSLVETELFGASGQFPDLRVLGNEMGFDLIWVSADQLFSTAEQATHALPAAADRLRPSGSFMLETTDSTTQSLAATRWLELSGGELLLEGQSCHGIGLWVSLKPENDKPSPDACTPSAPRSLPRKIESRIVVTVPVYNEGPYILATLQSLARQTHRDFLALISDNASTDETSQICRDFCAGDSRFHYVRHEKNQGSIANLLYCLAETSSEFFMFLGGHDALEPEFLAQAYARMLSDKRISLVYSHTKWIDEHDRLIGYTNGGAGYLQGGPSGDYIFPDEPLQPHQRYYRLLHELNRCEALNQLIRRDLIDPALIRPVVSFDLALLCHLAAHGPFSRIDQPLYVRREFLHRTSTPEQRMTSLATALPKHHELAELFLYSIVSHSAIDPGHKLELTTQVLQWMDQRFHLFKRSAA